MKPKPVGRPKKYQQPTDVTVCMDASLRQRIDRARGDVPISLWVRRVIEARLNGDP